MTGASSAFLDSVAPFYALRLGSIPDAARAVARQSILDWFGCALAGSREPLSNILRQDLAAGGPVTVVGTGLRASVLDAALINGAAGHALDYDDTHLAMTGHPTAPILPAVLALAEEADAPGEDVLTAFVTGVEVACRLGLYIGGEHYRLGWHTTGTVGTVGAAAACARLRGLDEEAFRNALNLAATQAAGLKASFGSMAKPLHAGKAAMNGLLSARLSAREFVGASNAFEGAEGLLAAGAAGKADRAALEAASGCWLINDMLFKYHASCYLTHAAINAAATILPGLDSETPESVEVRVHPSLMGVCGIPQPASGLELKFSLRGTVAMALLGLDTADAATFTEDLARRDDLVALRDRVTIVTDPGVVRTVATIAAMTRTGRHEVATYDTGKPERDLDLQQRRLSSKFRGLAGPVVGPQVARELESHIDRLEALASARHLLALASTPVPV
ncbi:MAG TPA: MmgE/PrpD family protein [Tepidiformaceae bacterium]